jgi:hypothetical protein
MNTPSWMSAQTYQSTRSWVRRARGRRASDRVVKLETVLAAGVILAWAWGVYELTLLFLH